jgi:hypothetical protein
LHYVKLVEGVFCFFYEVCFEGYVEEVVHYHVCVCFEEFEGCLDEFVEFFVQVFGLLFIVRLMVGGIRGGGESVLVRQ